MINPQSDLIAALQRPQAYGHAVDQVEHLQTHISHVLLAGDYAYKIKKPLDLGFLDFSTLAKRKFCCEEELRLNKRLADDLYLDVVPIAGSPAQPSMGGEGEPLEYAVKMRRFPQEDLLTRQPVTEDLIDRITEDLAVFHRKIPAAAADSRFGLPEAVLFPMQQNFDQIRPLLNDTSALCRLDPLESWTRATYDRLRPLLARRRDEGHIRECHGDLHLGNIALVQGKITIFDGIEFNPSLRWIDTINEAAFFVMDLEQAGKQDLAQRFLNRYLDLTGDYEGLSLLDFYKVYRALVRAKVTAIRLSQPDLGDAEKAAVLAEYVRYIALAESYVEPRRPALFITCGVSGSGKSRLARILRARLAAVHIRSDAERKRLFGLVSEARSGSELGEGIYTADATERTYGRLRELAGLILDAGYSPIVDATFLEQTQRQAFREMATAKACPLVILVPEAPEIVLRQRVRRRHVAGTDASEADLAVLDSQLRGQEPLGAEELKYAVRIDTVNPPPLAEFLRQVEVKRLV